MADPFGLYDKLFNTAFTNAPQWMREEAMLMLFKVYDNVWQPVIQDLYPRTSAPALRNGAIPNVDTPFYIPNTADPQTMSRFYDYLEMPDRRSNANYKEEMQARMAKEWGPTIHPLEYKEEFKAGFLDKRNQILAQNAVRSISRLIEYTCVNYTRGVEATMINFGDQYAKQITDNTLLRSFDLTSDLTGKAWDDADANPMDDIVDINLYLNEMAGGELKEIYLGANTAAGLEKCPAIYNLVKYHYDATKQPIAASIKGVTLKKVIGQTYKDDAVNSSRIGYPGMGDVRRDGWTTRRKFKMMVDAGTELGFAVTGPLGNLFTAKCDPNHGDTNIPYVNEWTDARTKMVFSEVSLGFTPYVYSFANIINLTKMATATV